MDNATTSALNSSGIHEDPVETGGEQDLSSSNTNGLSTAAAMKRASSIDSDSANLNTTEDPPEADGVIFNGNNTPIYTAAAPELTTALDSASANVNTSNEDSAPLVDGDYLFNGNTTEATIATKIEPPPAVDSTADSNITLGSTIISKNIVWNGKEYITRVTRIEKHTLKRSADTEIEQPSEKKLVDSKIESIPIIILSDTENEQHPKKNLTKRQERRRRRKESKNKQLIESPSKDESLFGISKVLTRNQRKKLRRRMRDKAKKAQFERTKSQSQNFTSTQLPLSISFGESQSELQRLQSNGIQLQSIKHTATVTNPFKGPSIELNRPKNNSISYYRSNLYSVNEKQIDPHFIEPPGTIKPINHGIQIEDNLKASIIDNCEPDGKISSINQSILETALIESVDQALQFGNIIPKFLWYGSINGIFNISCQNMETLQFLKRAVGRFGEIWRGARLQVIDNTVFIKATVWIPSRQLDDPQTVIQRIARQNEINVMKWQIMSVNQKPGFGQQIILGLDNESAGIIKRTNGLVNYGITSVTMKLEYQGVDDFKDADIDFQQPSTSNSCGSYGFHNISTF